jgi:hypothetical protein
MMKKGIVVGLTLIAVLWAAWWINALNGDVKGLFGVRSRVEKVEHELRAAQIKIRDLEVHNEFYAQEIGSLKNSEYKRTLAVCRAFPQAKECKWIWDLLSGNVGLVEKNSAKDH